MLRINVFKALLFLGVGKRLGRMVCEKCELRGCICGRGRAGELY